MAAHSLTGVLPVFQTPYHDDESIDFATLEKEIDWLFSSGSDGVVMAMVSELLRLSDDERKQVAEAVCKYAEGRGPVVISVGAEFTRQAEDFARHAESVGASALMAIPPVSVGVGEGELQKYYERNSAGHVAAAHRAGRQRLRGQEHVHRLAGKAAERVRRG